MRIPTDDLYAVIGVPPDADQATIRRAYRMRARKLHPDVRPEHERAIAHEEMVRLTEAYAFLSDPVKRWDYNASRRRSSGRSATSSTGPPRQPPPNPPPPSPPPPPPPPPPLRTAVVTPKVVDFGTVQVGQWPPERHVTLRFSDGSRIARARKLNESGPFWYVSRAEYHDVSSVTIRIFGECVPPTSLGWVTDKLRVQLDEVTVSIQLKVTVTAAAPPPASTPAASRPSAVSGWFVLAMLLVLAAIVGVTLLAGRSSQHQTTGSAPSTPAAPTQTVPGAATPPSPTGWQVGPLISSDQQPALGYVTPRVTVAGQTLYEAAENQDGRTLLRSIDLATGRVRWTSATAASTPQANWSSEVDETGDVVISTSGDGIFGLDATTGQLKWSQPWPGGVASPVKLVVATGVVVMVDSSQQVVQAYRAETGAPLWSRSLGDGMQAREMASDGHTLVVLEDVAAVALDLATGRVEWNQTLDSQSTNLLHLAGVAGGRVVIGASDWIEARSLASGNQLWRAPLVGHMALWPMASEQVVLAHICLGGCADGTPQQEVAYDAATGRQLWTSSAAYWEIDRPPSEFLVGGTLTRWADAAGESGVHILQATSGQVTSSPTASGTTVFAVADEQLSYVIVDDSGVVASRP